MSPRHWPCCSCNRFQRVIEIALEVGSGDVSHFLKTFKLLTDVNPREYRKRHVRLGA
jgi:AraC-like DNA-binding protein